MNTFANIHTWWDVERVPLIPPDQGESFEEQVAAGVRMFQSLANKDQPFSLIRIGDSEIAMLSAGLMRSAHPAHDIDRLLRLGGTDRGGLSMRPSLIDAIRRTDLLGLQQHWRIVSEPTFATLCMLQIPCPPPNAIEVHAGYAMLTTGALFDFIEERRVLLVGALAGELAVRLRSNELAKRYSFVKQLRYVHSLTVPAMGDRAYEVYPQIVEKTLQTEFDVALLAFGTYAKPLAVAIRDDGRTALDVGFCFNALLGDPERRERPVLRQVNWDADDLTRNFQK